jgi:hypothetical protein
VVLRLSWGRGVRWSQIVVVTYMYVYRTYGNPTPIQAAGARPYDFGEALRSHVSEPGGFALLLAYLCGTWMFQLMPASYYSFQGGVQPVKVLAQLLIQVSHRGRESGARETGEPELVLSTSQLSIVN